MRIYLVYEYKHRKKAIECKRSTKKNFTRTPIRLQQKSPLGVTRNTFGGLQINGYRFRDRNSANFSLTPFQREVMFKEKIPLPKENVFRLCGRLILHGLRCIGKQTENHSCLHFIKSVEERGGHD